MFGTESDKYVNNMKRGSGADGSVDRSEELTCGDQNAFTGKRGALSDEE